MAVTGNNTKSKAGSVLYSPPHLLMQINSIQKFITGFRKNNNTDAFKSNKVFEY